MKIINSIGPRTEPSGTAQFIGSIELIPLRNTNLFITQYSPAHEHFDSYQTDTRGQTDCTSSTSHSRSVRIKWSIESKALVMSINKPAEFDLVPSKTPVQKDNLNGKVYRYR